MWIAILVLSAIVLVQQWYILQLVNRLLIAAKVEPIAMPKRQEKEEPPVLERQPIFRVPIEG